MGVIVPMIKGGTKAIEEAERSQLVEYYENYRAMSNEWLKRQIVQNNRIDILMTAILGYQIQPFHLAMLRWQFLHPDNLQLAFRGAGKSTACTISKSIHLLLKNPNLRILIASKTAGQAQSFLKEIKAHFESNDKLIEVFGPYYDPRQVAKWDNAEIEVLPRTIVAKEGSITTIGAGAQVVGKHYDIIFSDDLVDEENSRTKHMRDKNKSWYYQSLDPTLEPPDPRVPHRGEHHRSGTRYHYDDLYGHLIENEMKDHHQIVPALNHKGQSPWPGKYPPDWFAEKRKKSGIIIFNAQYQCHSEDTEFLTENGWKLWNEVGDSKLATVNIESGKLVYQEPTGKTRLPFDGELLRIHSNTLSALVTPNHRMLARPSGWTKRTSPPQGPWKFVEAGNLGSVVKDRVLLYSGAICDGMEQSSFSIPEGHGGRLDGRGGIKAHHQSRNVSMDVFLRFLGYFIAEGSTTSKDRGGVRLDQNEGRTLEEMKVCFAEMGLGFKENVDIGGCHSLDARHIGLWRWLRENVKTSSYDARIPRFVFGLSNRQMAIIFQAMVEGDGHIVKNVGPNSYQYTTASKQLADDFQELSTMLCMDASLQESSVYYCVCARNSIGNGIKPNQISPEKYTGDVVCFQVPNHTLITRFNGKVLVSGNCDTEAMKGEIFQYDDCQLYEDKDLPKDLKIYMGVDLAISEKDAADKFAIVVVGIDGAKNYFVLDYYENQLRFKAQTAKIIEYYNRWDPIRCGIETVAYQEAQYQNLKDEDVELRLKAINTGKDKITRAWKLSSIFEDKRMFFRKGSMNMLIEHLVLFPNFRYKDLFDALDLAVSSSKMRKRKKRRTEPGVL